MRTFGNYRNMMLALAIVGAAGTVASADFAYNNFSSTSGLTLVGAAVANSNRILVTPSASGSAGAVWSAIKQGVGNGFDTTMIVHVQDKVGGGSDGLALVIQNASATALGASGLGLGYGRNAAFNIPGITNSFALEVDTWNNTDATFVDQAGANHIAFQSRGLLENVPDITGTLGSTPTSDLSDGSTHSIRLRYAGGFMDVFLDGSSTAALHTAVNLSRLLDLDNSFGGAGRAWIGVTASTGGAANKEAHVLDSWYFTSTVIPAPGAAALMGIGGLALIRRRR